ncbi:MAG: hypothetical protein PHQ23_14100, partial [Candidatus Wallbacteria bacterium]|nr:hypothetical protein [Candidatus Wallbacteria bacterium]
KYNKVLGTDFTLNFDDKSKQVTWNAEYLKNEHGRYAVDQPSRTAAHEESLQIDDSMGFSTKLNYRHGSMKLDYDYYKYGRYFWIETSPWYKWRYHYGAEAYDWDNTQYKYAGRAASYFPLSFAERHNRMKASYDFDLGEGQKVVTEYIYDRLRWGNSYEKKGQLHQFHVWPEFHSKLSGEFIVYQHFDPGDQQGRLKSEVKLFTKLNEDRNTKCDFGVWTERDVDSLDSAHHAQRGDGVWTEYSYNHNDRVWVKYFLNYNQNKINWINDKGVNEQKDDSKFEVESNIDLTKILSASVKAHVYREWPKEGIRSRRYYWKAVFNNNFTSNFKGKFGYLWWRWDDAPSKHHINLDLTYNPDSVTELRLQYSPINEIYGYSYFEEEYDEREFYRFTVSTQF